MYNLHGQLVTSATRLDTITQSDIEMHEDITIQCLNLKTVIVTTHYLIMTSPLYGFATNPYASETFNTRVAVDVLSRSNTTDAFLNTLKSNIDTTSASVSSLLALVPFAITTSTETSAINAYQHILTTLINLNNSLLLFDHIHDRYHTFKTLVHNHKHLMNGQNITKEEDLFRYVLIYIIISIK